VGVAFEEKNVYPDLSAHDNLDFFARLFGLTRLDPAPLLVHRELRSFGTTTSELMALSDWLESHQCTHVVMEATGVYWKPVWHLLEEDFELVLVNAQHVKTVPGRKTDVGDAQWLVELLAHGLVRSSFVPPVRIQELRDLTRTRKQRVRELSQHTLRIQKVLEDANLKLGSVLSSVVGKSGRAMLKAIVEGETNPEKLAACYFMLRDGVPYRDLGAQHFDPHDTGRPSAGSLSGSRRWAVRSDIKRAA
jgi:transposase